MLDLHDWVLKVGFKSEIRTKGNDDNKFVCDLDAIFLRVLLMFEMNLTFYLSLLQTNSLFQLNLQLKLHKTILKIAGFHA